MAWSFGDGFDLYAAQADAINGYWDSGSAGGTLVAGRFAGSRAIQVQSIINFVKTSGANDAVHHIVVAFLQTAAISGSSLGAFFEFFDGATAQCSIVFRGDGAILFTSGGPTGTVLDTYTGAFTVQNTWYAFEFEVIINNTTGSWAVRKNGNSVNDHSLGSLNTRVSANNYANKLQIGAQTLTSHDFDDLYWRSDAASVPWMGDIRCYTRMPASDQSVQFARSGGWVLAQQTGSAGLNANTAKYDPFTVGNSGTIGTVTLAIVGASTANFKCAIYSDNAGLPGTPLGSATPISAPGTGTATFTFGTPVAVTAGTKYWVAIVADAASGSWGVNSLSNTGCVWSGATYASFPTTNPPVTTGQTLLAIGIGMTTAVNWPLVSEPQQDTTTSYVYDSTVNDADFYGIASIASTPVATIAVTTRGYMQKSDAGTRTAAVQLKSGSATVASPTLVLTTSGWQWAWRTDTVDPNTSAAWTAAAVNNAQVGPKTIA